jgi:hypothetical protein
MIDMIGGYAPKIMRDKIDVSLTLFEEGFKNQTKFERLLNKKTPELWK